MHLILDDESLCESALRVTSHQPHFQVMFEYFIVDNVRRSYMPDNKVANYELTSLESTMSANASGVDIL